jgi:hypothetical protein
METKNGRLPLCGQAAVGRASDSISLASYPSQQQSNPLCIGRGPAGGKGFCGRFPLPTAEGGFPRLLVITAESHPAPRQLNVVLLDQCRHAL